MAATELDLFATHEVLNQAPPLAGHDVFGTDVALAEGLEREGAAWADDELHQLGREAGDPDWQERGRLANQNPPDLVSHDRYGHRVDAVRYHPAYHELMGQSVAHGLHAAPWADDRPGAHVARAAKIITWYQVDGGQGSGNVICLDVLRALARAPEALDAYWDEVALAGGADERLDGAVASLKGELADLDDIEMRARRLVERMALVFQASLLARSAPAAVADAFVTSRLAGDSGRAFGTLPPGLDLQTIVDRARPEA